jgi:hypothetical protein
MFTKIIRHVLIDRGTTTKVRFSIERFDRWGVLPTGQSVPLNGADNEERVHYCRNFRFGGVIWTTGSVSSGSRRRERWWNGGIFVPRKRITESMIALGTYAEDIRWVALQQEVPVFDRFSIMKLWVDLGTFDLYSATKKLDIAERIHTCIGRLLADFMIEAVKPSAPHAKGGR